LFYLSLSYNSKAWNSKVSREAQANSLASTELQRILKRYSTSKLYKNSKHTNIKRINLKEKE
jgi:hypothetical protein